MFGRNPKRKPELTDGSVLQVQEIFSTFQGEGIFAGRAAVFVRLGGCNLACAFCDTEFESFSEVTLSNVISQVNKLSSTHLQPLAVITGGEPLRQNIVPLCEGLLAEGFTVQLETNGTLWQKLPDGVHVICSPKANNRSYHKVRPDVLAGASALKFIISAGEKPYDCVPDVGQGMRADLPIYVQPMDEYCPLKNAKNMTHTIKLAQKNGYNLSLQLHKMFDVA